MRADQEIDPMQDNIIAFTVTAFLREMRERLEEAHGLAEAADACARVGQVAEGVALANKTDDAIHDAETLLGITAWLARQAHGPERPLAAVPTEAGEAPATLVGATLAAETIRIFLRLAHERLHRVVGVARAAEMRTATAGVEHGARLALEVEPALFETQTLINAASLVNRLAGAEPVAPPG
jgi:hypothetical protein